MASWRDREDLGTAFVAQVYEGLRVDDHWGVDYSRGFRWWASDYAQTISADVGVFHNLCSIYRVHAEIDLLRGRGKAEQFELYMAAAMARANLNALVFDADQDTFRLNCTVYVTEENKEWLLKLFLAAVALQVSVAHTRGPTLAGELGTPVASTQHPTHGMRESPHPMVHAIDQFFVPPGAQPSRWIGVGEWEEATDMIRRLALVCSTDGRSSLHAEFAWGEDPGPAAEGKTPIRLAVLTDLPHAFLGNGLSLTIRLPINLGDDQEAHTTLELNALERKDWKWWHDLGSWCSLGNDIAFTCFVPNTLYNPHVLPEMVHGMALRAQWVNELFMAKHPLLRREV
ncbi:MAG: hypothetical protein M9921_12390 [Fimbriimonadaceae bacterium]|nr:hypothetical protein [Fimbriimonadaceae bacterium]